MAADEHPDYTRVFAEVFDAELEYIQSRRESVKLDQKPVVQERERLCQALKNPESKHAPRLPVRPSSDAGLVGLALSGGGIRSATFNLGLLQALAKRGILRCCDYLSTVSGGGYIGSCFSSLLDNPEASVNENKFPFRFQRDEKADERKEVKWLRQHGNYLAPNQSFFGWDLWRMIGMYLSGLVLTNIVPFSLMILLAFVIYLIRGTGIEPIFLANILISISLIIFGVMVIARFVAGLFNLGFKWRQWRGYFLAYLAAPAAAAAALGVLIVLAVFLPEAKGKAFSLLDGVSLASAIGLIAGLFKSESKRVQRLLQFVFRIAWVALLPLLFAQLLRLLWATNAFQNAFQMELFGLQMELPWLVVVALLLLVLSLFINTNRISLHHFYRDRLSEAYVINRDPESDAIVSNEPLTLAGLHTHANGAPYQLINTTLNVPDSEDPYLIGRGTDFFVFSKLYCGGDSTGYRRTVKYDNGQTRLATALAISGAAASPQMGTSTSPILTFLMTLLNVRLNRWMPNPNLKHTPRFIFWPYYFVKELLGKGKETDRLLNLSDGGHHENLGIYPLIKRGCSLIIASDSAADPAFRMEDLANLLRKVRIDLGVDIEIDLRSLRQEPQDPRNPKIKNTPQHYAVGKIRYPRGPEGLLIYIKSSLTGREPEDLLAYRRRNPSFPDETTADQFFDEAQFESYRELGELTGEEVFSQEEVQTMLNQLPRIVSTTP